MANEPIDPKDIDRPWRIWASAAIAGALAFGTIFAFLILPAFQRENAGLDLETAARRALGVTAGSPAYRQPVSVGRAIPVSQVTWGPEIIQILMNARTERGEVLAREVCTTCHGEEGVSATPDLPSIAGQSPAAIYKQLHDYRTGARVHPQMTPVAKRLAPADLASVAAFFGARGLPNAGVGARDLEGDQGVVLLATKGDSARRIPACNSCHTNGSGGPIETPALTGQHATYLANQLHAYKSGRRRNDVYSRMRLIAAELSDAEIEALALYYQGTV